MEKSHINKTNLVHVVLGHSYLFYFFGLIVGFLLTALFPYTLPEDSAAIGYTLIVVGTILTFWAQGTSRSTHEVRQGKDVVHDHFFRGPYKFTRSPTHLGLGVMMLGLALVFNSLMLTITAVLSYFVTRYIFISKEESLLANKYGEHYLTYKKRVPF